MTSNHFTQPSDQPPQQIGFDFRPHEAAWDKSFEELRLVAVANEGVAHVPRGDPERPELGMVVPEPGARRPPPARQFELTEPGSCCT